MAGAATHESEVLLVSSGTRVVVGGIFALADDRFERVDPISTRGLAYAGGRLARSIYNGPDHATNEILVYDERGARSWLRSDGLLDPHDVLIRGDGFIVVCSEANAIAVVGPDGSVVDWWRAPTGVGDAWHLNCAYEHEGRLVVSAFGRFAEHRGWVGRLDDGHGIVFDWESGEDIVAGLNAPHHPRFVDGAWLVCEARSSTLVRADPDTGGIVDRLRLRGFLRGIAVADDVIYVGESAAELSQSGPVTTPSSGNATVAVVDRDDWRVIDRIALDCQQIYDLLLVPPRIRDAVATGFRTGGHRTENDEQDSLFARAGVRPVRRWAVADPLPVEACRVEISGPQGFAGPIAAASTTTLDVSLINRAGAILPIAAPHPVRIGCAWVSAGGRRTEQRQRTQLRRSLPPGEPETCRVTLQAPDRPGRYTLVVTLVQEGVRWFDAVSAANSWTTEVAVAGERPGLPARVRHRIADSPRVWPLLEQAPQLRWALRNLFARRAR